MKAHQKDKRKWRSLAVCSFKEQLTEGRVKLLTDSTTSAATPIARSSPVLPKTIKTMRWQQVSPYSMVPTSASQSSQERTDQRLVMAEKKMNASQRWWKRTNDRSEVKNTHAHCRAVPEGVFFNEAWWKRLLLNKGRGNDGEQQIYHSERWIVVLTRRWRTPSLLTRTPTKTSNDCHGRDEVNKKVKKGEN